MGGLISVTVNPLGKGYELDDLSAVAVLDWEDVFIFLTLKLSEDVEMSEMNGRFPDVVLGLITG